MNHICFFFYYNKIKNLAKFNSNEENFEAKEEEKLKLKKEEEEIFT